MRELGLVWFKKMVTHHSVFITHHSSLITHHLKHPTLFGTITHLSSLNIFQLFVGPIHVPCAAFTLFFFFLQLPVPKLTELVKKKKEKKKKKEDLKTESVKKKEEKKKKEKKKKPRNPKEGKKKKEKKK